MDRAREPSSKASGAGQPTSSPQTTTAADALGLILPEGAAPAMGQERLRDFLARLRPALEQAVNEALAGTGRTATACPWIDYYLDYFAARSVEHGREIARRWLHGRVPAGLEELRAALAQRAAQGARAWVETGRVPETPPDIPRPGPAELAPYAGSRAVGSGPGWTMLRSALPGADDAVPSAALAAASTLGSGVPVAAPIRTRAEASYGTSLGRVRIHADSMGARVADAAHARAVTFGDDIAFGSGWYRPGTLRGDALIAHELAHVAQQRAAPTSGDPEQGADQAALGALTGTEARPGGVGGLRLQRCSINEVDENEEDHEALRRLTPEQLIARYTTAAGDLKEDDLGALLAKMAWYTPAHYPYVRRLFEALDYGDRDDVAAAMVANTRDADLMELARTPEGRQLLELLVGELREGWVASSETYAALRALRALRARSASERAGQAGIERLEEIVAGTAAPVDTAPAELLGKDDLERRLRLVEVSLDRLGRTWRADSPVTAALAQARARVPDVRQRLGTDTLALSRTIPDAQVMLESLEIVLAGLDSRAGDTYGERGTEEARARLVAFVRARFVEALGATLGPEAGRRFAQANAALSSLSTVQTALDLAVLRERPGLFADVDSELQGMRDYADWLLAQVQVFDAEGAAIAADERRGQDVAARRQAAEERYALLGQALRVVSHWEQSINAAEALESGWSFWDFSSIGMSDIHAWVRAMAAAARKGDAKDLAKRLKAFEDDKRIGEYYEHIPAILRHSAIVVGIGVTLVAAAVTWGVGAAVAAPAAGGTAVAAGGTAAAGATTSTVTLGSLATGVGAVAANALIFTSVHRGLSEIAGIGAQGTFLEDFLWNFGLFGALRIIGGATGSYLRARNLMRIAQPVQLGVSFSALEVYGLVRFGVENKRWPSAAEFGQMTGQNLVMLAALSGMHATFSRFTPLGRFQARYGENFAALEARRLALERDTADALRDGKLEARQAELRQRGEALKQQFADLTARVLADADLNLAALREQLKALGAREVAAGALTQALGMPQEVALARSGGEFQFSYRNGETARVVDGARALGAREVKTLSAPGRPTVVEASFEGRPSMMFVERPAEAPPAPPLPETLTPQEQNARSLETARDALARRRIAWTEVPKDLRGLERAKPRSQTAPATIEETARQVKQLEAWIAARTETPWQTGAEAKLDVPVAQARAQLSELPAGELRDHLQADDGAVVVYGALRQTSPTAGARMQALWDAWTKVGREGEFADFAESALREEAVAALRAGGDTALAAALEGDPRVQNAFARMGYDVARLRAVQLYFEHGYKGDLKLPEYLQHQVGSLRSESRAWGTRRGNLAVPIPATGYEPLRSRLNALRSAGTLSDVDAGILWRWNGMIRALIEESAAQVPGNQAGSRADVVLRHLLDGLGKDFSESAYRTFRHRIRDLAVDDVIFMRGVADTSKSPASHGGTPVRPWAEQLTRLEAWEGRAPAGDSATIGALWTAYAQARFALGLPAGSDVASIGVVPDRSLALVGGRMGDAVLNVTGPLLGRLSPGMGEWATDYKGGSDPFDVDQARAYDAVMQQNAGSFVMGRGAGAHTYKGLIYIFRNADAATRAAASMNDAGLHANLKVAYFGQNGSLVWLR